MAAQQYIMIAACLLLAALLVWQEVKRKNKTRLLLRIIASILAIISLILLAVPIQFNAATIAIQKEAVLLTEGYNKDSVDNFLKQHEHAVVYTAGEYEEEQPADMNTLHVFGYGISKDEWEALPPSKIVFHPSPVGNGITAIGYKRKINSGDALIVQGKFNNTTNKPVRLSLNGFGITADSVIIYPNQQQSFQLKTIPKFIGRTVYTLTATANKDIIAQESLPVEVQSTQPLKVLLLAAFPDFENKFLQNWLSENNYVFATRTTISKNKYSVSFADTNKFSLNQLTPNLLGSFDVLIADATALSAASKNELFNIKNEISENGLGLIIKSDSTERPSLFYNGNCKIVPAASHNRQILSVQLPGNDTISSLPVENSLFIHAEDGVQDLVTDTKKNVLACNTVYGEGSIVFSTLNNTYYWMLSGDKKSYRLLWSLLIEKASKKKQVHEQWNLEPAFPKLNEPVILTAQTISEVPLRSTIEKSSISFAAQPFLPFEWEGTYWPDKKGWQYILSANNERSWFYVFDNRDWKNITALQKINDTHAYASENANLLHDKTVKNSSDKKTIPAYYFFILFACSCIFLWIEKKLS